MENIWRNRIWAGTKTFAELHEKAPRYEDGVLALMWEDVEAGLHTKEEFIEKTGAELE